MLHDTFTYKDHGADGGPGLTSVLLAFLKDRPEFSVVFHTTDQHGLTVLSCRESDKPKLPGKITMAANLAKAAARHVADGLAKVDERQFAARLEVCSLCPVRNDDRCSQCGCPIERKAAAKSEVCPLGHWRDVDAELEAAA